MDIIPLAHSTMFVNPNNWTKKITIVNEDLKIDDPEMFHMLVETLEEETDCEIDTDVLYKYLEKL